MISTVLITGGTGLIGSHLVDFLIDKGYHISILTRKSLKNTINISYYNWDIKNGFIEKEAVLNADAIIHLAGTNLMAKKWSTKRKEEIISSRVLSTRLLYNTMKKLNKKLKVFVASSAIGYYGAKNSNHKFIETDNAETDFLGNVCSKWENEIDTISDLGLRVVKLRIGVVFAKKKSALQKMTLPFKMGLGSVIGTGEQILPWICIDDLCNLFHRALLDAQYDGTYNAVQGNISNLKFSELLAKLFGRKLWLPKIPSYFLKLLLGERAIVLLNGSSVSSEKINSMDFKFIFKNLEEVLRKLLNK